jgi:hypothetical protein
MRVLIHFLLVPSETFEVINFFFYLCYKCILFVCVFLDSFWGRRERKKTKLFFNETNYIVSTYNNKKKFEFMDLKQSSLCVIYILLNSTVIHTNTRIINYSHFISHLKHNQEQEKKNSNLITDKSINYTDQQSHFKNDTHSVLLFQMLCCNFFFVVESSRIIKLRASFFIYICWVHLNRFI